MLFGIILHLLAMALESTSNGINSQSDLSSSSFPCSTNGYLSGDRHGTLEDDRLMPIAIVGFSLKFPQDAISPDAFWKMLTEKRCAMTDLPTDRVLLDGFYNPDGNRRDTVGLSSPSWFVQFPRSVGIEILVSMSEIPVQQRMFSLVRRMYFCPY